MMKFDDLEDALRQVPRREPPPEWRAQILHGTQASLIRSPQAPAQASRTPGHSPDAGRSRWPWSWDWNWNWAWSGLAAGWLVIGGMHTLTPGTSRTVEWTRNSVAPEATAIARTPSRESDNDAAWREQRRLLAQLLGENPALPAATEPKRRTPTRLGPRSDRSDDGLGQLDSLNPNLPTATV